MNILNRLSKEKDSQLECYTVSFEYLNDCWVRKHFDPPFNGPPLCVEVVLSSSLVKNNVVKSVSTNVVLSIVCLTMNGFQQPLHIRFFSGKFNPLLLTPPLHIRHLRRKYVIEKFIESFFTQPIRPHACSYQFHAFAFYLFGLFIL